MTNLVSLLLVLMLMASPAAMPAGMENGVQMDMAVTVDKDAVNHLLMTQGAYDEDEAPSPEMMGAAIDLINLVTFTSRTNSQSVQMEVALNQQKVAGMQIDNTADGGVALTTDVLPSYAFVMDGQTRNILQQQLAAMNTATDEQVMQAADRLFTGMMLALNEETDAMRVTEVASSAASYTYETVPFNYVTVKTATFADGMDAMRKMTLRGLQLIEDFYAETGVEQPDGLDLAQARTELENVDVYSENYPENAYFKVTKYQIQEADGFKEGYSYTIFEINNGCEVYYVSLAQLGGQLDMMVCYDPGVVASPVEILMAANDYNSDAVVMNIHSVIGAEKKDMAFTFSVLTEGISMKMVIDAMEDELGGGETNCYFFLMNDTTPIMRMNMKVSPLTQAIEPVDVTALQQLNVLDLANDQVEPAVQDAITLEAQNALSSLLIKVITAAPEQVELLMNEITNMMYQQNDEYTY